MSVAHFIYHFCFLFPGFEGWRGGVAGRVADALCCADPVFRCSVALVLRCLALSFVTLRSALECVVLSYAMLCCRVLYYVVLCCDTSCFGGAVVLLRLQNWD